VTAPGPSGGDPGRVVGMTCAAGAGDP
jgi:hypothetical protein